jgi:hypothetical protein
MAHCYEVRCPAHTHRLWVHNMHYYRLADGAALHVAKWPIWCYGCGAFTLGEWLPSVEELRQAISECEHYAARPGWIPHDRYIDIKGLPDLRVRERWREARTAPPRCLDCGSSAIVLMQDQSGVEVPGEGWCTARFWSFADAASPHVLDRYYTPEGERTDAPAAASRSGRWT